MPAQKKKETKINLLPQDKFAASPVGRVLSWLLSTFRIIVILIEFVVMGAFLSRFWLDAKNSDLNDELKQKSALVQASSDFEQEFRSVQQKLATIKTLESLSTNFSEDSQKIASATPSDIFLVSSAKAEGNMSISGTSPSERSIAQLIANLESIEGYSEVSLSQLNTNVEDGALLGFTITIQTTAKEEQK